MWFQICFRVDVDRVRDEQEYEDEIMAEIFELQVELEEEYQRNLAEYKKEVEVWKLWRKEQV